MKKYRSIFDEDGNFKNGYDPYRREENNDGYFNGRGWPNDEVLDEAYTLAQTRKLKYDCDAIKLIHACKFSSRTKGNYSPETMWK